nr:reverse transcriptase domain-containing protein [Tanacetum cinerariifolium]
MLFPYSLEDRARIWACPHHGFSELTQIDTFYNGLTEQDQDSLNAAAGVDIVNKQVVALAKAVEKVYVTCGGADAYYECIVTDSNPCSICAATGSYNQVSLPNRASHQIPPHGFASVQNNPNRFNQNQGQENYFNQGNNFKGNNFQNNQGYRSQVNNVSNFQNQGFQNQPFSVPNNQIPPSVPNELSSYIKSNEIAIKTMQNQINVLREPAFNFGTIPSNTIPNPKGEMKAVTTHSGLAYEGLSIPTESSLEKVDEQNTEEILDKEHSNSFGSTAQVQPPVVPISILEPDVPRLSLNHQFHTHLVIIAKNIKVDEREALLNVLKSQKWAIAWKISDIKGIDPRFCTHKILMEDDYKPAVQSQRRVNLKIHDEIKKEVIKLIDAGMIYPISDSPWVSPIHCVPKKGGITVVANENNELIPTTLVTGWRVCIDYRKLNDAIRKEHFPLPFMDQMLERLAGNEFYCFLDGFYGYFQIPIDPQDQEKTTFTCPYGTFAYRRMPFGLCNAPEFDITILDKKGFENLATDHLSRLENPHQDVLKNKDINENFLLETLGSLTSHNTPWKLLRSSKLAMRDLLEAIMVPILHRRRGREKYLKEMRCVRTISKFVRYSIFGTTGDHRKLQLNELSELRDQAYENSVIYKERIKKLHNSKIKNRIFNVSDQVLLFNSRLKIFSGKLKTRWSGPFTITCVFPYGTIELSQPDGLNFKVNGHRVKYYFGGPFTITQVFPYGTVELSQPNGPNFKVNGHRVKYYFGGDIPSNVVLDLHTFPMDK